MKRLLTVAGLLALWSAAAGASSIGLGVGAWDTDQADQDSGTAVRADLDVGGAFSLQLRYTLLDSFATVGAGRVFTMEAAPLDLGVAYKFEAGERATPYLGGGLSYVVFDADVVASPRPFIEPTRVSDEIGWYGVAGVDIKLSRRLAIFLEGLYRPVKATIEGQGIDSFTKVQVDFAGVGGALGLAFTW